MWAIRFDSWSGFCCGAVPPVDGVVPVEVVSVVVAEGDAGLDELELVLVDVAVVDPAVDPIVGIVGFTLYR